MEEIINEITNELVSMGFNVDTGEVPEEPGFNRDNMYVKLEAVTLLDGRVDGSLYFAGNFDRLKNLKNSVNFYFNPVAEVTQAGQVAYFKLPFYYFRPLVVIEDAPKQKLTKLND